jgi:PAS domain S-box-containing protein
MRGLSRTWAVPVAIVAALGCGLAGAARLHYLAYERDLRGQVERELSAVADLKVDQIAEWREQLLEDASSMLPHPFVRGAMVRLATGAAREGDLEQVTESLRSRLVRLRLARASLVGLDGHVLAATSPRPPASQLELAIAERARREGAARLDPVPGQAVLVALPLADDGGRPVGAALFEGDVAKALPRTVRAWPTRSRTAEILFGALDGDRTLVVEALRHAAPAVVPVRLPSEPERWPLSRAARGESGAGSIRDYRDVPVFEVWRPIPGAPWGLVVKIDEAELDEPARARGRLLAAGLALALLAGAVGLAAWWRGERRALDRRARELDARAVRQRLDHLWSHANDIVLVASLDGRLVDANERALEALGYGRDEMLRLHVQDLGPADARAELDLRQRELVERGGTRFESRYRRRDGSTFPAEVSIRTIDVEGRPLAIAVGRDVSERKQVERLARLQGALLHHLSDAVVAADRELRVTAWTGAAERIFGRRATETLGRPLAQALGCTAAESEQSARRARVDAGEAVRCDETYLRADGRAIDAEVTWAALREEEGTIVGYLVVSRDVTEQRRTTEALRLQQERFRLALEVTDVGIADVDLVARRAQLSPRHAAMLGRGELTVSLDELATVVHPEDASRLRQALEVLTSGAQERVETEHRVILPSGEIAWHRLYARVVERGEDGRARRVLCTAADISRERRLQAHLVFADRLVSIGTLAAGVAHEINNPLSYLLANFEFLEERLRLARDGFAPDGEALSAVREARDGARRIAEIVRGLRTFSRRDGDGRAPGPANLNDAVRAAVRIAEGQLRPKARLVLELAEVPPVRGSEHELAQVALNLLVNATQAIPEGRPADHSVCVTTSRAPDGRVALEVSDSGQGIPPEHLARIFDPFFTTKPVGEGSGLGLSICHGIIETLGGVIEVQSAIGRGTRFRVLVPCEAVAAPAPRHGSQASGRRGRVLVLDDEVLVCRAVARTLSREHEVVAVTEPGEALGRLQRGERFDLVLCDLMMPGLTGMECYEALRASRPELAQGMIFLTGGAFTPAARAFLERVSNLRVEKPFDAEALRQAVARGVERASSA